MRIYTAAYGYRDCDPMGHVAGKTPEECAAILEAALTEERDTSESECESAHMCECGHGSEDHGFVSCILCDDCREFEADSESQYCRCDPDLWSVGPFEESLLEVVHNIHSHSERRWFIDNLRMGGAFIPIDC